MKRNVFLNHWMLLRSALVLSACGAISANAGTKIGNGDGGDAVLCHSSQRSDLPQAGYYSLDYLATLGLQFGDVVGASSWAESSSRIEMILNQVAPDIAQSFVEYSRDVRNTTDYTRANVWEIAPFGLVSIDDQQVVTTMPENCLEQGTLKAVQAVVHQNEELSGRPVGKQIYNFVPQVLDELERTSPLQLSFLYVHEWLWKHSDNVSRNRRINRFLHGTAIEQMSAEAVRNQLVGMGLNLTNTPVPRPQPQPGTPTAAGGRYAHPESDAYVSTLFEAANYCKNHSRRGVDRTTIGANQKFRFYSKIMHPKRDLVTYENFAFKKADSHPPMADYVVKAKIEGMFSDIFSVELDAGEVQFSCMATTRDQPGLGSNIVVCNAIDHGVPLYWPNSTRSVNFDGVLTEGCFYAKSDVQSLGADDFDGQFVIVGSF